MRKIIIAVIILMFIPFYSSHATIFVQQSTAVTIVMGPFVDDTDGVTAETGLSIAQADIRLSKNGGNIAQSNNSAGATADELGYYDVPLDSTDTNTLGTLKILISKSGALPVWENVMVITAEAYNTLCNTTDHWTVDLNGTPSVNVAQISGDSTAADNLESACDGTGYNIGGGSIVASSVTGGVTVTTNNDKSGYSISGTKTTLDALNDPAAADCKADVSGLATSSALATAQADLDILTGSDGAVLATSQPNYAPNTTTPPTAAAIRSEIDSNSTQLAAIVADTNEVQGDLTNGGRLDLLIDAIKAKTDNLKDTWNDLSEAQVNAQADASIETYRLDELMYAALGSQPTTGSLFGDLTEDNSGTQRFTSDALAQAPTGSGTVDANVTQINGTNITGTGTQVALGFQYFFNVPTPAKTINDCGVSGSGLSQQDVRDAMMLAPSTGIPASNSIDDQISDVQADLDNPSQYKADVSGLAQASICTETRLAHLDADISSRSSHSAADVKSAMEASGSYLAQILTDTGTTIPGALSTIDTVVDGIQSDLDNTTDGLGALKTLIDTAQADLDNPTQYQATSVTVSDKTGFSLSSSGIDAILDETVDSTRTMRQILTDNHAVLTGESTGAGTGTIVYQDLGGNSQVTITVDETRNRTSVTLGD